MSNLHKFQTGVEYSAATLVAPSVSWVVSGDTVHYDKNGKTPSAPTLGVDLRLTYNISNTSNPTKLYNEDSGSGSGSGGFAPTKMWIDGVEVTPTNEYTFSTSGNHVVEYNIGGTDIPNAFKEINEIVKVEIGENITYLGTEVFKDCYAINEVTCYCQTSPSFGGEHVFSVNNIPLYIPRTANISSYELEYWVTMWNMKLYAIKD